MLNKLSLKLQRFINSVYKLPARCCVLFVLFCFGSIVSPLNDICENGQLEHFDGNKYLCM